MYIYTLIYHKKTIQYFISKYLYSVKDLHDFLIGQTQINIIEIKGMTLSTLAHDKLINLFYFLKSKMGDYKR